MNDPATSAGLEADARAVVERLRAAGFQALWAGGCVRDHLLGRPAKDIDIATDARPEQVQSRFPVTHAVGRAFGVVLVQQGAHTFEVATFRRDVRYVDGRHPESVEFTTAEEDARRRDFTINGLFLDPLTGQIHDYVQGQADIKGRIIRAIGDPFARFAEDHLRLLRAVRFATTLDFSLDPGTRQAMQTLAGELRRISAERVQQELTRILTEARQPGQALALLADTGLCVVVLPEVAALRGVEQPPEYHPEGDVFRHTVLMLDQLEQPTPELAWSVLLHDIGKPSTQRRVLQADGRERIRFDGHAEVGAQMAEQMMQRLRCSNALTAHVVTCVRQHMRFMDVTRMRKATLRRMVMAPTFATEMELHRVDCLGSHGHLDNYEFVRRYAESLEHEPVKPEPLLRGGDILATGVVPGPEVKRLLQEGYDLQLEGQLSTREAALNWLEQRRSMTEPAPTPAPPPDQTEH